MYHKAKMRLESRKHGGLGRAFVLLLVVCVIVFAVHLRVSPPILQPASGDSHSQVKFWVNPSTAQNTKVKLATLSDFPFVRPVVLAVITHNGPAQESTPDPMRAVKDAFADSSHWFRPPPLS